MRPGTWWSKVVCFFLPHEWEYKPEDNHTRLTRECFFCLKKQGYHTGDSLAAPTGWWGKPRDQQ